jgi:hypothetical protein
VVRKNIGNLGIGIETPVKLWAWVVWSYFGGPLGDRLLVVDYSSSVD